MRLGRNSDEVAAPEKREYALSKSIRLLEAWESVQNEIRDPEVDIGIQPFSHLFERPDQTTGGRKPECPEPQVELVICTLRLEIALVADLIPEAFGLAPRFCRRFPSNQ